MWLFIIVENRLNLYEKKRKTNNNEHKKTTTTGLHVPGLWQAHTVCGGVKYVERSTVFNMRQCNSGGKTHVLQ